jgi:hypothetical protein
MGIINMAHGEMIAVGAYTCYVVQNLFGSGFGFSITLPFSFGGNVSFGLHLPGLNATGWVYESYFLFAIALELSHGGAGRGWSWSGRHPLSLPPPAGIAAGDLGRFPGDAAAFPHGFRREQCAGQFALLAAGPFLRHDDVTSATTASLSSPLPW